MITKKKKMSEEKKEEILKEFLPFIKYMAYKLAQKLPSHITIDDLKSVGVMGLMDAVERFEPGRVGLKSFAEIRIKGAMIDELRSASWIPRSLMKKIKEMNAARAKLEQTLGRMPDDQEVADFLKMPLDEYFRTLQHTTSCNTVRLENLKSSKYEDSNLDITECIADPYAKSSLNLLEEKNENENLKKLLNTLPEKQRMVLSCYYFAELTMHEIGKVLNVTESRICQIHVDAIKNLRTRINKSCNFTA